MHACAMLDWNQNFTSKRKQKLNKIECTKTKWFIVWQVVSMYLIVVAFDVN